MKCKDMMTKNPAVCYPHDTVERAAQIMQRHDVGPVPVVEDARTKRLVGLITDRDLAMKVIARGLDPRHTQLGEVMSTHLVTCREKQDASCATEAMSRHQVRRVPVVDDRGSLVGIIAQADVARKTSDKRTGAVVEDISQPDITGSIGHALSGTGEQIASKARDLMEGIGHSREDRPGRSWLPGSERSWFGKGRDEHHSEGHGWFGLGKGHSHEHSTASNAGRKLRELEREAERAGRDLTRKIRDESHEGTSLATIAALVGAGVGLMYFLDPQRGRARRNYVRDKAEHLYHQTSDTFDKASRDLRNRASGAYAETRGRLTSEEYPDDETLVQRVRSKMGREVSHPRAIEVDAHDGEVTLRGPILADEVNRLVRCVTKVKGVRTVNNQLEVHEYADIPSLQGGSEREGSRMEFLQSTWGPSARVTAGVLGGALTAYGLFREGAGSKALAMVGAGLLVRAITNQDIRSMAESVRSTAREQTESLRSF
jgi:CBS domain-containing protein/osmotically-inducible protein OsmY